MKTRLLLCFLLSTLPLACQVEASRRDGNGWIEMPAVEKAGYMMGVLDGMNLGRNFIVWSSCSSKQPEKQSADCAQNITVSFQEYVDQYVTHVTVAQLVEGLDVFYKDYRNRKILTVNTIWIVLNEIAGTPRLTIDTLIENSRKHAND